MSRIYFPFRCLIIVLLSLFQVTAQSWKTPINTTICNWNQGSGVMLQQDILLNGGSIWWQIGFSDGSYGVPESDGNVDGTFYSLPLTDHFNTETTNLSSLFLKGPNPGTGQENLESGAMFGNDEEIVLYGGLARLTDSKETPSSRELLGYRSPEAGSAVDKGSFFNSSLPDNVTRYVTKGGQVSVPSENLAFYFGGMRGRDWGPITSDDASANTTANTLIMVNFTSTGDQKSWKNSTLPKFVTSRANPQLIWIPASEQGLLVVVGGVKNIEDIYPTGLSSSQKQQNSQVDVDFLTTIPIYDIAQDRWYLQNATGEIPSKGRTSFCSTLASASDGSSHNIYIYGGYDGQDSTNTPYDDVYVLSLPSFVWIKVHGGSPRHGRSGHQCFGVLPSQMLVVGGLYKDPSFCLEGGPIQIFNLNDLEFQTAYSPVAVEEYQVPNKLTKQIGGTAKGNASRTAPETWGDTRLKSLFDTSYTKTVPTWYPYSTPDTSAKSDSTNSGSSLVQKKSWIIPVTVGVTLPFVGAACVVIIWLNARRKRHIQHGQCDCSPGRRHWLHLFCHRPKRSCPIEADGVPIEPTSTVLPARIVNVRASELSAQDPHRRGSVRSSIMETPTQMYPQDPVTPEPFADKL